MSDRQKRSKIDVDFPPEMRDWLEARARSKGQTLSDYMRAMADDHRRQVEAAKPERPRRLTRREQYLDEVRKTGGQLQAGRKLGVTGSEISQWSKNPDFPREVALAKMVWLESLEQDMVSIGRGRMKGDTQALGWILNAHHPNHGRAKKELLLSMINPLIKRFGEFLVLEFGNDARDKLKKAVEKFKLEVRKKLVGMS